MSRTLLSVANLTVERGGRRVLHDLSFALEPGDIMFVGGRNGTGKSTLLRTIAGLLPASGGTIALGAETEEIRGVETVHYVGYEDGLKPTLTVAENLEFWAALLRNADASITPDPVGSLEKLHMGRLRDVPAAYLSAGQKRRVALAKLHLAPRPIWLLDEPYIALDSDAQARLSELIIAHGANGGTALLASHQQMTVPHKRLDLDRTKAPLGATP